MLPRVLPAFSFAAQTTLLLNGRLAPDTYLQHLNGTEPGADRILDLVAELRTKQVRCLRPLILLPGLRHGLSASIDLGALLVVVVSDADDLIMFTDAVWQQHTHLGVDPPLPLAQAGRELRESIALVTQALAQDRLLIGTITAPPLSPPSLPDSFSESAREVAASAFSILEIADLVRVHTIDRDQSAVGIRAMLRDAERAAVSALASVITPWTLTGVHPPRR